MARNQRVYSENFNDDYDNNLRSRGDYDMDYDNRSNRSYIEFIASNTTGEGYFTNVGRTLRQGIDASVKTQIDKVMLSLSYSFIDATYQSPFQIANDANSSSFINGSGTQVIQVNKGDRIPGIAQNQIKLRSEWQALPQWSINGEVLVFSDQYAYGDENNEDPSGRLPGYAVVNLDTRYTLPDTRWQIFADINNLFNTKYANGGLLGQNNFYPNGSFRTDGSTVAEPFLSPGSPFAVWVGVSLKLS